MTSDERQRLAGEGYAPGLGIADPAVAPFTTLTASFAVNELLARLFGYGLDNIGVSELVLRLRERKLSLTTAIGRPGHYCIDETVWGRGDVEPFIGQIWS
jgi:hypothetical protein